jgi:hypothetical protein
MTDSQIILALSHDLFHRLFVYSCTRASVFSPPRTCPLFRPKNSHLGEFFKVCITIRGFHYLLFLKAFAYFNGAETAKEKYFYHFLGNA